MRPVSARFLRTLRGSHGMVADARVVPAGATGVNPPGVAVPVLTGDVRLDPTANIRSTVDLTVAAAGWWPSRASSPLAPYGNEVLVRRGIRYGDGTTEWVSLGYHRIYSVEQSNPPHGPVRVEARDRMSGLIDARLIGPVQFPASTTRANALAFLVREVYPTAVIEWDDASGDVPLGRAAIVEEDRHAWLDGLVSAAGKVWWWDHRGHLVIRSVPSPSEPVWRVNAGEGGVLVSAAREINREGVYNAVVATGEGLDSTTPVQAVAYDDAATSPTRWGGPFGRVPRFYSSPLITTAAQARQAARSMLQQSLGLPYSVDFSAVPHPGLEPHDPVLVDVGGRREIHVVAQVTIPLDTGAPLSAQTREQTFLQIGG